MIHCVASCIEAKIYMQVDVFRLNTSHITDDVIHNIMQKTRVVLLVIEKHSLACYNTTENMWFFRGCYYNCNYRQIYLASCWMRCMFPEIRNSLTIDRIQIISPNSLGYILSTTIHTPSNNRIHCNWICVLSIKLASSSHCPQAVLKT